MTFPVTQFLRPPVTKFRRRGVVPQTAAEALERSVRRRIAWTWGLLVFNTMTYIRGYSILSLPSTAGKGIAQLALPLAILIALSINPRMKARPNVFLCIVSLLIADAILTATQVHHLGTTLRTLRFAEFLFALWLLTPWFGRRDMLLFRIHLRVFFIAVGSVVVGLCIAPGRAFSFDGRLTGTIWPMLPTAIAEYSAVVLGLMVILWTARLVSGKATLVSVVLTLTILLLTHTRTALAAMVAGLVVAGFSMFTVNARVRKFFATIAATVSIAVVTVAGIITTWLARGESKSGLVNLTGRTDFWAMVLNLPRSRFQEIFGFGISNASVNGLPIDSNWMSSYLQEGLFGIATCIVILVYLLVAALFQPKGVRRALILFLVVYCLVASFTEDGFTDVSPYLLHLTIAASLFV